MPYQVPRFNEPEEFQGGKQILASLHFKYTEEGGTIDAAVVGNTYVPVGSPFVQSVATKRYVPFVAATHVEDGVLAEGFRDPVLTLVDFHCNGVDHVIVGQLIYEGTVYEKKLPATVTNAFKQVNPRIRYENRGL